MRFRKLGNSDLQVSEISLGSWLTYSGGVAAEQTRACTEAAFDAGINFFDTANAYGQGAAETAWGEILSEHPRDSYILATKVFGAMSDTDQGLSGEQIAKQIDASLTNPAAHRPRRPVPGPSLRPDGADRGDHRGVPEGRGAGQGPGRSRLALNGEQYPGCHRGADNRCAVAAHGDHAVELSQLQTMLQREAEAVRPVE
jgi:hypothetical protein